MQLKSADQTTQVPFDSSKYGKEISSRRIEYDLLCSHLIKVVITISQSAIILLRAKDSMTHAFTASESGLMSPVMKLEHVSMA